MLILTRRNGQSIMIGNDIEIIVTKTLLGSVNIGIKAPKDVDVHRKEIFLKIEGGKNVQK